MTVGWCARLAFAVPAHPGGIVVRQPDGTEVTVTLRGDEYAHWHEDEHGYAVTRSPETRRWVYALRVDGTDVPTTHVVGQADPRALRLPQPDLGERRAAGLNRRRARPGMAPPASRAPTSGTMSNLVVLVDFSDLAITYTTQEFDDLFNEAGHSADGAVGSVKDYFHEVSYNALTVQSTVVAPVTLDNGYAYYGANDAWGNDIRPREMVAEALAKLETRGFDFSQVDGDGDGWVDCLTIVHAGRDEAWAGNDPNYIWSHAWVMSSIVTYDGVNLWPYHTVPAQRGWDASPGSWGIERIGVICHEMGHLLGLPDLYDTTYASEGVGNFCLMAGGSWNGGDGRSPAHMSAWCKVTLGWVTPTVISTMGSYSLTQVETAASIYKLQGTWPANEFFLVENRQGVGFDAAMPGTSRGILIWHVDENQAGNTDPTHYKVDLEEASGTQHLELNQNGGDDLDYFRAGNATEFTDTTTPDSVGYSGAPLGLRIKNIGATGETMSFEMTDLNTISGYVLTGGGDGIDDVVVTAEPDGNSDTTDVDGRYELTVQTGWSGTVTPTKTAFTFVPVDRSYANVASDQADEDFQGTPETGTLSVQTNDQDRRPIAGQITVDGDYKGSGLWSGALPVGEHTVAFGTVSGYAKPAAQQVTVQKDQTTSVTGMYVSQVLVTAAADPQLVVSGGASTLTTDVSGGLTPYTYEWDTGQTTAAITVNPAATATYTVTVTDSFGQQAQASATVEVASPLTVTAEATPGSIEPGGSSRLSAVAEGGQWPYSYRWNTGAEWSSIVVRPTGLTTYIVTATDSLGQTASASVTVRITQVAAAVEQVGAPCFAPPLIAGLAIGLIGWSVPSRVAARRKRGDRSR